LPRRLAVVLAAVIGVVTGAICVPLFLFAFALAVTLIAGDKTFALLVANIMPGLFADGALVLLALLVGLFVGLRAYRRLNGAPKSVMSPAATP
jgi:hypothetical protein